jgi:hypothetical protein
MPDEKPTREQRERVEDELDRELEQTFPGSDPLKVTRSSPRTQITPKSHLPDPRSPKPDLEPDKPEGRD